MDLSKIILHCIEGISLQLDNVDIKQIDKDTIIVGEGGILDSLGVLLLLVELEQHLDKEQLTNRSLVHWFASLDYAENSDISLQQFSELLYDNILQA